MKIKNIKKINNKYKIILENNEEIDTYDDIIIKNNILYKKEIEEEIIKKINKENEEYNIYNEVLKYIKQKLRSKNQIKIYMDKKNINKETQEKIINKLTKTNLINDEIYIKAFIHDKIKFTNDGPKKIKQELEKENLEQNIIEKEISKIDKEEIYNKLKRQIQKKINTNTKYSKNMIKQKLLNYFTNLGYEKNDILNIMEKEKINDNDIIKKEYIKIYNKLKIKYKDEELNIKVKQKLYQKGFTLEEINKIIN